MKLRSYQSELITKTSNAIAEGYRRICIASPTGSGKSFIFTYIAKKWHDANKKILIVSHRKEILFQTIGYFDVEAHPLTAETKEVPKGDVIISMLETLYRRVENKDEYHGFINQFNLVILDECHWSGFAKLFPYFSKDTVVLGYSATPFRARTQPPLTNEYEILIQGVDTPDLVEMGYLASPRTLGQRVDLSRVRISGNDYRDQDTALEFARQEVYSGVIKNYEKHTPGKKALIFATTVESSQDIVARLKTRGHRAEHIDANTPKGERDFIYNSFKEGQVKIISNVGILTAGVDIPDCEVVILYFATKSITRYLQAIGRGSRVTDKKHQFWIMDFGGNVSQNGFWQAPREWTLEQERRRFRRETNLTKECPDCEELVALNTTECPNCGYVWERTRTEQMTERIEIELQEMTGSQVQLYALGRPFEELEIIRQKMGYKKQWCYWQVETLQDLKEYGKFMGYEPKWFYYAQRKFKPKNREQRELELEIFKQQSHE